jgi:hypothetical protein
VAVLVHDMARGRVPLEELVAPARMAAPNVQIIAVGSVQTHVKVAVIDANLTMSHQWQQAISRVVIIIIIIIQSVIKLQ